MLLLYFYISLTVLYLVVVIAIWSTLAHDFSVNKILAHDLVKKPQKTTSQDIAEHIRNGSQ